MNHETYNGTIEIYTDNGEGLWAKVSNQWFDIVDDQQIWDECDEETSKQNEDLIGEVDGFKLELVIENHVVTWAKNEREHLSANVQDFLRNWEL